MKAINVPPSEEWHGNTGPWSTFSLEIGDPPQYVSVLAATSKSNVWAVTPGYCANMSGVSDCSIFRGGLYDFTTSQSFEKITDAEDDAFELPFGSELDLGYNGTAVFGTDAVKLGEEGSEVSLGEQAIAAFGNTDPFLATGLLGLSNQSLDILNKSDAHLSPLATLREKGKIPSMSWAYNAGARYRQNPSKWASLVLGGYDSSRGGNLEDALKVPMQAERSRDLLVWFQGFSIGSDPQYNFTFDPVEAFIDSVVPDIWLPDDVCQIFEEAFDLEWNETAGMYLLDDAHRQRLYNNDSARVVLELAQPTNSSNKYRIEFPYAAFDSQAQYPLAGIEGDETLHYFALKRTNQSGQVYLGHTFLQEA